MQVPLEEREAKLLEAGLDPRQLINLRLVYQEHTVRSPLASNLHSAHSNLACMHSGYNANWHFINENLWRAFVGMAFPLYLVLS